MGTYKFCDDETYTINNVPTAATTEWGYVGDDSQFAVPGLKVASSDRFSAIYKRDGYNVYTPLQERLNLSTLPVNVPYVLL